MTSLISRSRRSSCVAIAFCSPVGATRISVSVRLPLCSTVQTGASRMDSGKDARKSVIEVLEVPNVTPLERTLLVVGEQSPKLKPAFAPVPRSGLFDKLQSFLPQMAAANSELQQKMQQPGAGSFDIEEIPEGYQGDVVEMDVVCGILDLKNQETVKAAEAALEGRQPFVATPPTSDDDSDEDSVDTSRTAHAGASIAVGSDAQEHEQLNIGDSTGLQKGGKGITEID